MAQIIKPFGATKNKTIVGRGASSKGRACGRGHDGQNSRTGGGPRPGFEGGQMPLYRRVARRGFSNYPFKVENQAVSLSTIDAVFEDGAVVSDATLREAGVIKGKDTVAKILATGEITKKVTVEGLKLSKAAQEKIEAAGGSVK
ncbi:MAG: 50S ribosomal protein L15 [Candidatus Ornithospirochaeta sp.]|nr:50S ribosomal protein L15 [Sphaerochaetaceae bacterium]MDD7161254.1 50S ribosomal protein L15 [Sphaerochaetaceae bacterium]MDY5524550.1 50S ribosomal protein L15 [Candidatus Ornithospirochaeta sp.]